MTIRLLIVWVLMFVMRHCVAQTNVYVVFEGDSTTYGDGVNGSNYTFFAKQIAVGHQPPITFTNIATGGDTISNNVSASDTLLRLTNAPAGSLLVASVYLGLNDISAGYPHTLIETNLLTWVNNVRGSFPASKILMHTIWTRIGDSPATDVTRSNINSWIRASAPVDLVIDSAADDRLNPEIHPENFIDNVHPSISGHRILATNIWNAMDSKRFLGPHRLNIQSLYIGTLR